MEEASEGTIKPLGNYCNHFGETLRALGPPSKS